MNVLDLFSGIGGFSLGLERAGMRTVAFCERDEFCRAVLRKHWPDVPCFNDVRTLDANRLGGLGRIDLVCGGFPCQPFSIAGKQTAQADDRHLWPAMREVIASTRPAWVIGENVTGLITLALDDVLADLEGLGYAARPFVIPAVAVDARHRRDRVWIIASDADGAKLRKQSGRGHGSRGQDSPQLGIDGPPWSLADSNGELHRRRYDGAIQDGGLRTQGDEGRGDPVSNEGYWSAEPDVDRVAYGISARVDRLKALGNAVVPQVVEEIGRAIMRCAS